MVYAARLPRDYIGVFDVELEDSSSDTAESTPRSDSHADRTVAAQSAAGEGKTHVLPIASRQVSLDEAYVQGSMVDPSHAIRGMKTDPKSEKD